MKPIAKHSVKPNIKSRARISEAQSANPFAMFGGGCKDMLIQLPQEPDLVYYLYGPLEDEADYIELIHTIRYSSPEQQITIHINSPGGSMYA